MTVVFRANRMCREDAEDIMARMWAPGTAELQRMGADTTPECLVEKFMSMADYGFAFTADGDTVAICGAQHLEGTHYTWFMATPELAKVGRDFTLWLRKFCRDIVARDGLKLEMYSASAHENSDRWFSALGFVRGNADSGIFRHYKYTSKNKLTVPAQ